MLSMRDAGEDKMEITEMKEFVDSAAVGRLAELIKTMKHTRVE
jgi:hypothetical protein